MATEALSPSPSEEDFASGETVTGSAPFAPPENPYANEYENFLSNTANHRLTVLSDDGLNRRMRMHDPEQGSIWSWTITTWPGYLSSNGDIADGYTFSRIEDMMQFFDRDERSGAAGGYYEDGAPSIDFRYWAEKLTGGRSQSVLRFSEKEFLSSVREHLEEHEDLGTEAQEWHEAALALLARLHEMRGLSTDESTALLDAHRAAEKAVKDSFGLGLSKLQSEAKTALAALWQEGDLTDEQYEELTDKFRYDELDLQPVPELSPADRRAEILLEAKACSGSEHEAREWLNGPEQRELFGDDTWEWSLRDYDVHFLFACWAIDKTVQAWKEYVASRPSAEDVSQILALARKRVDERFEIVSHGEVGELSNGALILKLAELASGRLGVQPAVPAPAPDPALGLDQKALSALMEFAERGYARELGAIDVRHQYTEAELAGMRERFDGVRRAIDALRLFKSDGSSTIHHQAQEA